MPSKKPSTKRKLPVDFFERVYKVVAEIPPGRVTTYGLIALFLGTGRSARMVGYALNAVAGGNDLPCHRVVNRTGLLSGRHHFIPPGSMEKRLKKEKVKFISEEQIDIEKHLWDPMTELPEDFRESLVY